MDHKKLIYPAILLASVTACSDNDSSEPETPETPVTTTEYSVTAIDGYLRNAEVWLDVNGNFILDNDEPMTTSGESGKAVLVTTVANPEQYPVVVQAKTGITIDEDSIDAEHAQGVAVELDYVMSAPAGEKNITPLSTQVHVLMSHGESKEAAINSVATSLGLNPAGLLDDFIATENEANAFAASNIVDSQSLPADAKTLQTVATEPTSSEAQDFAKTTAAVNETIKETVDETNEAGGDFSQVEDIYDPAADAELDTDGDGVPDHIDAFPADAGRYLPSDKLAYTTYYYGQELTASKDNPGTFETKEQLYTGTTAGKPVWFYTPVRMRYQLSAVSDFSFDAGSFTGIAFTNIYVKPVDEEAYTRISAVASTTPGMPLVDTNWNKLNPSNDTYVLSVEKGETLNGVIHKLNKTAEANGDSPISKADFMVLSHNDLPSKFDQKDPEVTRGNFILKLGDSSYTATEDFTVKAYDFAKTYTIGDGQEIVIANAVNVVQEGDAAPVSGDSMGTRVWMYPADVGGESTAPYGVIAPLSDYEHFRFATDYDDAFVAVYVTAKDGANTQFNEVENIFDKVWVPSIPGQDEKHVYQLSVPNGTSLKDALVNAGRTIDELDLINYVDGPMDGDLGVVGNFMLKLGDSDTSFATSFTVSEFTFTAPSAE